ncbi:MAG TPA: hypothetical protein VLF93_01875 [Candidatus Saccharimonadales bacterium]|nr:hypothetical protein [Candidatus Saccharimonadales bacterium]
MADRGELDKNATATGSVEPREWEGPRHARPKPSRFSAVTSARDTLVSFARGLREKKDQQVSAIFEKTLDNTTYFRNSGLLRKAGPYIENGEFKEGVERTLDRIASRQIQIESVPREELNELTRLPDADHSIMVLPDDFEDEPYEMQLWGLLQRNMLLITQRLGVQDDPRAKVDFSRMAIAYTQSLRNHPDIDTVNDSIEKIEAWAQEQDEPVRT